ncbi:TetR/AcrR family transcriptional regulator [Cryptosporangium japonicum]|uniref:TetR/AcrR family transcriptional regulator n=1 Tax=Cryptosporangium japonicum TaxID=80872 RepID=A0ABN0URV5_9ACTN
MHNEGLRLRKKQQTRTALADAALRLVAERGLDQVTVEEISAAADVSPRTFFNYFATKDDAVFGTMLDGSDRIRETVTRAPADRPVWDVIWAAYREEAVELESDAERLKLRMAVCNRNPSMLARLVESGSAAELALAEALAERLSGNPPGPDGSPPPDGTHTPHDPAPEGYSLLLAVTAGSALRVAMMRWALGTGDESLIALVDEAFGALSTGFAATHHP